MPTTINASNTTGGAVVTGDGSGVLELQSGGVTGITINGANVTVTGALTVAGGIPAGSLTGTLGVANGGTGVATLTGYVKGSGTSPFTASATIPIADVTGAAASGANTDITALNQDVTITATGTIATDTIGFRGLPQNSQTGAYTLALADQGKMVNTTTGGVVIPANGSVAFPIGAAISIFNNSGSSQTISITTDTLRQAGTANTGSRTLAQYGLATCVKVEATTWAISGAGVT